MKMPWIFHVRPIEHRARPDDKPGDWFISITRGNAKPKYTSEGYPKRVAVRLARQDAALILRALVKVHD